MRNKLVLFSILVIASVILTSGCTSISGQSDTYKGDKFEIKLVNLTHAQDLCDTNDSRYKAVNVTVAVLSLTNTDEIKNSDSSVDYSKPFYFSRPYFDSGNNNRHYVLYDIEPIFRWDTEHYPYLDNYMDFDADGNMLYMYNALMVLPGESVDVYIPFEYVPAGTDKLCFDLITNDESGDSDSGYKKYPVTLSLDSSNESNSE